MEVPENGVMQLVPTDDPGNRSDLELHLGCRAPPLPLFVGQRPQKAQRARPDSDEIGDHLAERVDPTAVPAIRFDCGTEDVFIGENRAFAEHLEALDLYAVQGVSRGGAQDLTAKLPRCDVRFGMQSPRLSPRYPAAPSTLDSGSR